MTNHCLLIYNIGETGNDRRDTMNYENTELYFLQKDVIRNFGEEEGNKIFGRSAKLYAELAVTTDYRNSRTLERQLKSLIYPVIAYYKTLLAFDYGELKALEFVREETEKAAQESANVLAAQMRPLFPFHAFKRNIKNFIEYKFPSGAWKCSSLTVRGRHIGLHIEECLYYTITSKFGCPELCTVFCSYEDKAFGGLYPPITFSSDGTIATGHEYCGFSFDRLRTGSKTK